MKIAVIGGTGLIGSKLVKKLREQGHEAVGASPRTGVNTVTGEGLQDALKGASVVVDVTNSPSWEDAAVLKFFETSTRNLLAGEKAAGVGRHVALSVVGTERLLESGFFRAKLAQESLIKASSIPRTIVRATQFFEFVKSIGDFSTEGNQVRMPSAFIQPIAGDDVASAVAGIATSSPVNGTVEIGGPDRFRLDELIRMDLSARKDPREVITDPQGRYYGIRVTERALIPEDNAQLGQTHFKDWLDQFTKQTAKSALQPAQAQRGTGMKSSSCMLLLASLIAQAL
ncbi:MAG TPA: SDR family oxidoreductase [Bryobacteraceae bacterium]|nr:SDR family oxidoreductase [Bryobacteraceae bacterium]